MYDNLHENFEDMLTTVQRSALQIKPVCCEDNYRFKLEFQRTHTLCALSMHFQQSLARAAITALQLLVTESEIPSAAYMYIYSFAVVAQEIKV